MSYKGNQEEIVTTRAILDILNGVEDSLKEKLSFESDRLRMGLTVLEDVNIYQSALRCVQNAITHLLHL